MLIGLTARSYGKFSYHVLIMLISYHMLNI